MLRHVATELRKSDLPDARVTEAIERAGVTEQDLAAATQTVEFAKQGRLIREACDALDDLTFGARAGLEMQNSDSLSSYICNHCRDLREAIDATTRYFRVPYPGMSITLHVSGNAATIELCFEDQSMVKYHRHTEFVMFAALSRMRFVTQSAFFPVEVRFGHRLYRSARQFSQIGGFPVVFGAEASEIILPLSSLNLPIPTYDSKLRDYLYDYADHLLETSEQRSNPTLRSRIEGCITRALPNRMLTAEEVAATLGMSPRTFARRLRESGTTYRQITDELRCDLSKTFLKGGVELSEVSFALGYADQAAFSSAFKRWTGTTPTDFKATLAI